MTTTSSPGPKTSTTSGVTPSDNADSDESVVNKQAAFYKANKERLTAHVRKRVSGKTSARDVDDLVQDVFAIAIKRWDKVQASPNPVGWLFKAADNILLEHFKDLKTQLARFGRVADVDEEDPAAAAADPFTDPSDEPSDAMPEDKVASILKPLVGRPRQAEQVEMRFAHGLTVEEIALYLDANGRTVRNNTDRGLALLKDHYGQEPA